MIKNSSSNGTFPFHLKFKLNIFDLIILIIICLTLFCGVIIFGYWKYFIRKSKEDKCKNKVIFINYYQIPE